MTREALKLQKLENEIEERDEEEIDEVAPEPVRELAAPSINKKKRKKINDWLLLSPKEN